MKITYLKDAPLGAVGDIADVPDDQANVLIKLGIAKEFNEPKTQTKRKTKADKDEPSLLTD